MDECRLLISNELRRNPPQPIDDSLLKKTVAHHEDEIVELRQRITEIEKLDPDKLVGKLNEIDWLSQQAHEKATEAV